MDNVKEFQEVTFDEIIAMKDKMQGLASFVQNDFDRMLQDGMITKEQMKESLLEINKEFDKTIAELGTLKSKVFSIIAYYAYLTTTFKEKLRSRKYEESI